MEPQQAPAVPAVQRPLSTNSDRMVTMLSDALSPKSAQALATVEQNLQAPPQTLNLAPESVKEAPAPTPSATPVTEVPKDTPAEVTLKKGFDALEPATEAPKPPETPAPESNDFPPDAKTPEARNAWSAIKNEVKELKAKQAAWEAEKAQLAAEAAKAKQFTEADPEWKKYQAAQKRLEEVEPVIARVAYTKTAAYKETVEAPRNEIGVAAKALADQFKISDSKMVAALTETDPSRQNELLLEVSESMDDRAKSRLYRMADDLENLARLDERMASNAEAAYKEADAIEQQKQQQSVIERKAAEMRAITDSKAKLARVAASLKVGDETEDQAVNAILEAANATPFNEHSTEDAAFAVISAQLVPRLMKNLQAAQAALAAKEKYIAEMGAANPRAAQGQQAQVAGGMPTDLISALTADMAKLGIR